MKNYGTEVSGKISLLTEGLKNEMKNLWKDESAQGATEYILILAIVVGLAVAFGGKIKTILADKMNGVQGAISGFTPEQGN